jgi:hypothetical protein
MVLRDRQEIAAAGPSHRRHSATATAAVAPAARGALLLRLVGIAHPVRVITEVYIQIPFPRQIDAGWGCSAQALRGAAGQGAGEHCNSQHTGGREQT